MVSSTKAHVNMKQVYWFHCLIYYLARNLLFPEFSVETFVSFCEDVDFFQIKVTIGLFFFSFFSALHTLNVTVASYDKQ